MNENIPCFIEYLEIIARLQTFYWKIFIMIFDKFQYQNLPRAKSLKYQTQYFVVMLILMQSLFFTTLRWMGRLLTTLMILYIYIILQQLYEIETKSHLKSNLYLKAFQNNSTKHYMAFIWTVFRIDCIT